MAGGGHPSFECVIKATAQGVDAFSPGFGDCVEVSIFGEGALVNDRVFGILDFDSILISLALDLSVSVTGGIAGEAFGHIDDAHGAAAIAGEDRGIEEVLREGPLRGWVFREGDSGFEGFAGAKA